MIARGVPPSSLHVTGIPVRLEIAEPKADDAMRARHDLPTEGPIITLFGGGIEARRVRLVIQRLLEGETPGMLVVVAGRSRSFPRPWPISATDRRCDCSPGADRLRG